MDDPLRVRRKRLDIKVNHVMRLYTEYDNMDKREHKSEQKIKPSLYRTEKTISAP